MTETPPPLIPPRLRLLLVYGLFALGFLFMLPPLIGVIIAYLEKDRHADDWLGAHYRWLIRTFWPVAILVFILLPLMAMPVTAAWVFGLPVLAGLGLWYLYRLVKGFWRFLDGLPPSA